MKVLPHPRPQTHILKFLLKKPLRVTSWNGASFIPEISSTVNPKLARRNLAKDIFAALESNSPFSSNNSKLVSLTFC